MSQQRVSPPASGSDESIGQEEGNYNRRNDARNNAGEEAAAAATWMQSNKLLLKNEKTRQISVFKKRKWCQRTHKVVVGVSKIILNVVYEGIECFSSFCHRHQKRILKIRCQLLEECFVSQPRTLRCFISTKEQLSTYYGNGWFGRPKENKYR